jgi:O-methyltransferase
MNRMLLPLRGVLDQIRLRPSLRERIHYWVYGPSFREWSGSHPCEVVPGGRTGLYRYLMEAEGLDGPIDYLEFGVSRGQTIRWWVENNRHPGTTFVGFDTFEGLPESWTVWPQGAFSAGGEIPAIGDERCRFVKGLFQETLPEWLSGREFTRRTILHLDADLYTSTMMVLTQFLPKLRSDAILIFDEFDDPLHEYRAFVDATAAYRREFMPVCRSESWTHVALKAI